MNYLDRLERFMALYLGSSKKLNAPSTLAEIETAEAAMGVTLPDDARAAYLRFNGVTCEYYPPQTDRPPGGPSLFLFAYDWIDLSQMVETWRMMRELAADFKDVASWADVADEDLRLSDFVRPVDWHLKWIPVGEPSGGIDRVYIDLAPAPAGTYGQLIYSGLDFGPEVAAISFESYITRLLDAYDGGKLVVNKEGSWRTPDGALARRLPS